MNIPFVQIKKKDHRCYLNLTPQILGKFINLFLFSVPIRIDCDSIITNIKHIPFFSCSRAFISLNINHLPIFFFTNRKISLKPINNYFHTGLLSLWWLIFSPSTRGIDRYTLIFTECSNRN